MQPPFRSALTAGGFCFALLGLLTLPVLLSAVGLPSRAESYKSIPTSGGNVGELIRTLDPSQANGDVAFLGSSIIEAAIDPNAVLHSLTTHLHRPANVGMLALNWPGLDLQYFLLRDYLSGHTLRLLVWNLPQPESHAYDAPHIWSYRWLRYGEYSDAFSGLDWRYRVAAYGEMVIGAPRQLLSRVRSNEVGPEMLTGDVALSHSGYHGKPFTPVRPARFNLEQSVALFSLGDETKQISGEPPGAYQLHFAKKILELARTSGCKVVFIHIPTDGEIGSQSLPELADWAALFGVSYDMIGGAASKIFQGMDRAGVEGFYRDSHFNANGTAAFTAAVTPAILQAFDHAHE